MLQEALESISLICQLCHQSEQLTQCDIYTDKKCQQHLCWYCLHRSQNCNCQVCGVRIGDHFKKMKNQQKQTILDKGSKKYQRQFRIRSELQNLLIDSDLANIIIYYYNHDSSKYEKAQSEIKMIAEKKKKQKNIIYGEKQYEDFPIFQGIEYNGDGKIPSRYFSSPRKGIEFILHAFQ